MQSLRAIIPRLPLGYAADNDHHVDEDDEFTWSADVGDLEVGLEVLRAGLRDRVDRGDEHRTVGVTGADRLQVAGDVRVAAQGVGVVRRDASTSS